MGGLRKKMPVTFWTFVIATLALAGIPFFSGFYSKDAILFAALENHSYVLFGLGFFSAFLTAFYMTRLVWLCFMGKPRNQEKYDHAHESPWVMTVPLVVLAVLSFGVFFQRTHFEERVLLTPGYLEDYPETPEVDRAYVPAGAEREHHAHPLWFTILAWTVGTAGIAVGIALFRSGRRDEKTKVLPEPLHTVAKAKYYMDDFYENVVVAGTNELADGCAAFDGGAIDGAVNATGAAGVVLSDISGDVDQIVVDGAVNLTADTAQGAGAVVATAQTGRLRNYLAAAIGITAVVLILLLLM
jgi:NADH-quinone oxidoreductase subunit L